MAAWIVCPLFVCLSCAMVVNCRKTLRGKQMVTTYLQNVDTVFQNTQKHFEVGISEGSLKRQTERIRSVLTVAPRLRVPVDKNVHHCSVNKSIL